MYLTVLLLDHRILNSFGKDKIYKRQMEMTRDEHSMMVNVGSSPTFGMDAGLARTTTSNKVLGTLFVSHIIKKLPGYDSESKEFKAEI